MSFSESFLQQAEQAIRAALPLWDIPAHASLKLISVSENATYRATAADGRSLVLRLHRAGYHDEQEILSERAWIGALLSGDVLATPALVKTIGG